MHHDSSRTADAATRAEATLRAYLLGEGSVSLLSSGLRGVPNETLQRVLRERKKEFERLNPARAVLLDSLVLRKHA